MEWHPGPGAEELIRRKAQLQVLSKQLLDRERGLAGFRNELHAFETSYRKALGSRYARLDELAERLDETAVGGEDPGRPDLDGDGPAERYPGQGVPGGQNWAWGEREPDKEPERRPVDRRRRQAAVPPAGPPDPSRPGRRPRRSGSGAPT